MWPRFVLSPLERGRAAGTGIMPPRSQPKPAGTAGVMPPRVNAAGQSQLWIAASVGDVAKVRSLLAASEGTLLVNLQAKNGASPLSAACMYGHTEVARALLSGGAEVDLQTKVGLSPLCVACCYGHTEVVCALLSGGAKVDLQDTEGNTPLLAASMKGHTEVVRAMLSAGAKVDLQGQFGWSPLHMACHEGHMEVVRALLASGANVNLLDKEGGSPLCMACIQGHAEVVRALLSGGADIDLAKGGLSPLHTACHCGHIAVVSALLSAGAKADLRAVDGRVPLDLVPRALCAEVERLMQQAKEERGSARVDESRVGATVLPPPHPGAQSGSQLQAVSGDGGIGSPEAPGGLPAEASSISGMATSVRVCSMCGSMPTASSAGVAKLKACGRCLSVRYCSQKCQKMHWGEGGHKAACPQLREKRERRKGGGAGD